MTVIILCLIGGLRSFDLIWAMTRGGPGFTSDVIASVIYKQYQAGFYGLSTAGNVVLFVLVTAIIVPLSVPQPQRGRSMSTATAAPRRSTPASHPPGGAKIWLSVVAIVLFSFVFLVPFAFIVLDRVQGRQRGSSARVRAAQHWSLWTTSSTLFRRATTCW